MLFSVLCVVLVSLAASDAQTINFQNQTAAVGLVGGQSPTMVPDGFLAGGTVGDFSGDGFQDIYIPGGGGQPDRLFINDGDGTFTDQAAAWGIVGNHGGSAANAADYDGDGDLDLFVNSYQGSRLYQNQGASFVNVAAAAGLVGVSSTGKYGAAFGDYDLDGDLDLAIVGRSGGDSGLFSNDGDGTFTNVTSTSGVAAALTSAPTVVGFTVRFCDMNGDRYPELLWVGDFTTSKYLRNNGNGTFTRLTNAGIGFDSTEMGHCVADFDRDGDFDWYVTTINSNNLYRNNGNHSYSEVSGPAGVQFTGWGWGPVATDFDHDGRVDIAATSQSSGQFMFHNVGAPGAFSFVNWNLGFTSGVSGRGLANFDADNDGDQDLVVFPRGGPVQYFENNLSGANAHWIKLILSPGGASDIAPHGAGAKITVATGGQSQLGRIDLGSNYLSMSEIGAHFGVGAATSIDTITIDWANGAQTVLTDVAVDQVLEVEAAPIVFEEFIRGDANDDGVVNIADPIAMLGILFSGDPAAACADAVDVNDDGNHDISDPISALGALFSGGVIPAPAGVCGVDPTDLDTLDCNGVSCP